MIFVIMLTFYVIHFLLSILFYFLPRETTFFCYFIEKLFYQVRSLIHVGPTCINESARLALDLETHFRTNVILDQFLYLCNKSKLQQW